MKMSRTAVRALGCALAVGAIALGTVAASSPGVAAAGANTAVASAPAEPNGNANPDADVTPAFQTPGRISEMTFVPVNPCKLVDTRFGGGAFSNGETRSYNARGTGSLAGQGGSSTGCGIPGNAAALQVTVAAVNPTGPGYLQLNAADQTSPGISWLNYVKGVGSSVGAMVNLSQPGLKAFKVRNVGAKTDVAVLVAGYYIAPLAASVNSNGTLNIGSRVTLARQVPGFANNYEVIFDRSVTNCYYNATAQNANLHAEVQPRSGNPAGVFVVFTNNAGTVTPTPFYLTVVC